MKYFVTGATGFVGGEVARQLVAAGHEVVALARTPARAANLTALGIAVRQGDVTEKESMRTAMAGVDGIFHIAGWYEVGVRDKSPAMRINVDGTRNVLELARELQIPKTVYTSTLAVNSDTRGLLVDESYEYRGPWLSEYDRTKWIAHYEVAVPMMRAGLPLVIVQPGMVYGVGDTSATHQVFEQYLKGRWPFVPRGTAFCWGHVEDIARGHLLAMERGREGESYFLAGPAHTLGEAFEIAERVTGIKAPPFQIGPGMFRLMAPLVTQLEGVLPLPDYFGAESVRISAGVTYLGKSDKAQRELRFVARSLEQGMRDWLPAELRAMGR